MGYAKNENLRGLAIYDFSRLHSIEKIVTAPNIEYFSLGNRVWSKMDIESLKPLIHSNITHFRWWGNRILDNGFSYLAQSKIKELDVIIERFSVEELASRIGFNISVTIKVPITFEPSYISKILPIHKELL